MHEPGGVHVRQRPADPFRDHVRRLDRGVVEVDHAEDDRLAVQRAQHRTVQPRLRGLDGDLLHIAGRELGQERVTRGPLVDDRGVAEAEVQRRRAEPGHAVERPVDHLHPVLRGLGRAGLQVRLVELDDVRSRGEQVADLLVHCFRVPEGQGLLGPVVVVLCLLRHGERPRHGDLDGPGGVRPQELQVGHLDRVLAPDRADDAGHRVRVAAAVQRRSRVVDVHSVKRRRETVGVALPADLAVGDDVEAGVLLGADGQQGGVSLRLLEELRCDAPQLTRAHSGREAAGQPAAVNQPVRLRIASNE